MGKEPKRAGRSISVLDSKNFRVVVLVIVLFSLLLPGVTLGRTSAPPPDLLSSTSAEAPTDFIIGPQAGLAGSWFDTTEVDRARVHGAACPETPPTDPTALDSFILLNYYDLPLTEYILYRRTGDATFLGYAQKCADAWWKHPDWIQQGLQRDFENGQGPPPRHAGIGGLVLRALDGRPEMWDWINTYTRYHFDLWVKKRINDSQLYYGVREGAFALHFATWLAKVLPDSFPKQAGGTETNGAALRAQYLADIEAVSVQYFGRLQQADGSWRWNTSPEEYTDADGGYLVGIMQPFMVGLLLNALVDVHRLSTNTTVRTNIQNQITKACRHLYQDGPYRKDEPVVGLTGKRWRSFWYFYHGGTSVNPTKYQYGGGSYVDTTEGTWVVNSERQSISTIFSAYGYAYQLTGDLSFKTMGDELFDAAFGGSDGIRNLADGTAKNYNQNYRMGGRYLVWRGGGSVPTPTPTPTPSSTPTPTPTPIPTPTPTPIPTPTPTLTPPPTPLSSVTFVQLDTTTKGNWKNVYGGDGFNTVNDTFKYPSWAQVNVSGYIAPSWTLSTTDTRALQRANTSGRIAARWESNSFFTIDVNFTDGQTHRVAMYSVDWDTNNRSQRVDLLDWTTNSLLDSRTISSFNGGQYLVWDIRGRVKIVVNKTGVKSAVVSGIYFGGASPTPAPTATPTPTPTAGAPQVTLTGPTNGAVFVAGTNITLAANATDSNGSITKVEFYRSGTLIGSDSTNPYSIVWSNAQKGTYELTAKATDNSGLTTTSAPVSIAVTNSPNSVGKAKGRADKLVQQSQLYAGSADGSSENAALAADINLLTQDIVQAYSDFQSEIGSFGATAPGIDIQIVAAILFSKATAGLALRSASSPNIRNNLLRIASHLAIAEDLMRYGAITPTTLNQANATKTLTSLVIGQATIGYGMNANSGVAPASIASISSAGNPQPMTSQIAFASLLPDGTLPYEIGGLSVTVNGVAVPVLYSSPFGVRFVLPAGVPAGIAEVIISSQDGYVCQGLLSVEPNASRIMTVNDDEGGVAVVLNNLNQTAASFDVTTPGNFGTDKRTRLSFFATGISGSASNFDSSNDLNINGNVRVNFAEAISVEARLSDNRVYTLPVEFAGAQGILPGMDQFTVILIPELKGAGAIQLTLIVGGRRSNAPTVTIR